MPAPTHGRHVAVPGAGMMRATGSQLFDCFNVSKTQMTTTSQTTDKEDMVTLQDPLGSLVSVLDSVFVVAGGSCQPARCAGASVCAKPGSTPLAPRNKEGNRRGFVLPCSQIMAAKIMSGESDARACTVIEAGVQRTPSLSQDPPVAESDRREKALRAKLQREARHIESCLAEEDARMQELNEELKGLVKQKELAKWKEGKLGVHRSDTHIGHEELDVFLRAPAAMGDAELDESIQRVVRKIRMRTDVRSRMESRLQEIERIRGDSLRISTSVGAASFTGKSCLPHYNTVTPRKRMRRSSS